MATHGYYKPPLIVLGDYIKQFRPIKKQIASANMGNHEERLLNEVGNLTNEFCKALGIPYGSWSCKLTIQDKHGRDRFKIYYTHGAGVLNGTRTVMQGKLRKKMAVYGAGDCVIRATAHNHKLLAARPEPGLYINGSEWDSFNQYYDEVRYLPRDGEKLLDNMTWCVSTGCLLKQYVPPIEVIDDDGNIEYYPVVSYGEKAGYGPNQLGWIEIDIDDYEVEAVREVFV
jgi:hypothetical protein